MRKYENDYSARFEVSLQTTQPRFLSNDSGMGTLTLRGERDPVASNVWERERSPPSPGGAYSPSHLPFHQSDDFKGSNPFAH